MHSFHDKVKFAPAIVPVVATDNTALVSLAIDTQGFHGLEFAIATGTLADTDATFAVTLTQSDASNMSGAEAVPTDNIAGSLADASFTFAADNATRKIGVKELTKRYYQLTITPANNSGNAPIAAVAVLFAARKPPTT